MTTLLATIGLLATCAGLWVAVQKWITWRGKIALRRIDAAQETEAREAEREITGQHHAVETGDQWRKLYMDEQRRHEATQEKYEAALTKLATIARAASDRPPKDDRDTRPEPTPPEPTRPTRRTR